MSAMPAILHGVPGARLLAAAAAAALLASPVQGAALQPPAGLKPVVDAVRRGDCGSTLGELQRLTGQPAPGGSRAAYLLAHCLVRDAQFDAAARAFDSIAAAYPPLSTHARFYAAEAVFRAGRAAEAAARLAALPADQMAGLDTRARLLHAEALVETGQAAEARDILQELVTQIDEDQMVAHAWWLLGRAADDSGDRALAVRAFGMAWWAVPDNPFAAEAERRLVRWRRDPAPSAPARAERARRLVAQGRFREAEQELSEAVRGRLPPVAAAEAWYRLGLLRMGTRRAVTAFQQAARYPQQRARAWYWLGRAQSSLGRRDEAVAAWRHVAEAFAESPWAPRALLSLSYAADGRDDRGEARRLLAALADRYPASPSADEARWRLGWFLYLDGRFADAERAFLVALSRYPHTTRAAAHLYWAAKARTRRGGNKDDLLRLAATRYPHTFYGQRARRLLAEAAPVRLPGPPPEELRDNRAHETFEELAALGFDSDAVAAAEALSAADNQVDMPRMVARLYARLETYHASIAAVGQDIGAAVYRRRQADEEVWTLAYPRGYWDVVQQAARRTNVDPYLVLAVMREESRINPDAVSPAGAIGLMQLLPSTASGIAGTPLAPVDLMAPDRNIRYGTAYLAGMLRQFDGDVVLALAAYNAGPAAARRFARLPRTDPEVFLESIPFAETRAYVQRVLQTYGIYRWLYR